MTNVQFIELVREMRRYQREYFKTRSDEALRKSKITERRVDEVLAQQLELFN